MRAEGITVTTKWIMTTDAAYALSDVTSVEIGSEDPPREKPRALEVLAALLFIVGGYLAWGALRSTLQEGPAFALRWFGIGAGIMLVGVVVAVLVVAPWKPRRSIYMVRIGVASTKPGIYVSENLGEAQRVADAIRAAISGRSQAHVARQ